MTVNNLGVNVSFGAKITPQAKKVLAQEKKNIIKNYGKKSIEYKNYDRAMMTIESCFPHGTVEVNDRFENGRQKQYLVLKNYIGNGQQCTLSEVNTENIALNCENTMRKLGNILANFAK